MNIGALWDQLVDCVCRPPRDEYTEDDLIGQKKATFCLGKYKYYRQDVVLENKRGMKLQGSHFKPCFVRTSDGRLPCVVYCHCNSGSRRDAEEAVHVLLPFNITVFCLDFAGSGMSQGQWVTLGAHEKDDLTVAIDYLRSDGSTSYIGLWGRSMGAVTALLYSKNDPSIAGMVLDSPFSRLTDLMLELVEEQKLRVPRALMRVALTMMRRSVKKRAGFNIDDVAPLDAMSEAFIPALFGHAEGDTFINKRHSELLHGAYAGDKNLIKFEGDHNSVRPQFFYHSVLFFFRTVLQLDSLQLLPGIDDIDEASDSVPVTPSYPDEDGLLHPHRQGSGVSSDDASDVVRYGTGRYLSDITAMGSAHLVDENCLPSAHGNEHQDAGDLHLHGDTDPGDLQKALIASLMEMNGGVSVESDFPEDDEADMIAQAIQQSLQDAPAVGLDRGPFSPTTMSASRSTSGNMYQPTQAGGSAPQAPHDVQHTGEDQMHMVGSYLPASAKLLSRKDPGEYVDLVTSGMDDLALPDSPSDDYAVSTAFRSMDDHKAQELDPHTVMLSAHYQSDDSPDGGRDNRLGR